MTLGAPRKGRTRRLTAMLSPSTERMLLLVMVDRGLRFKTDGVEYAVNLTATLLLAVKQGWTITLTKEGQTSAHVPVNRGHYIRTTRERGNHAER